MGFNYGYEKKKFDSRWKRLEVEYCDAGMSEEQIAAMKEYDWAWFCSQRVFQNHTPPQGAANLRLCEGGCIFYAFLRFRSHRTGKAGGFAHLPADLRTPGAGPCVRQRLLYQDP